MKIFVFEYITAGGVVDPPESLAREGDAMLQALTRDLMALPEVELIVCRNARFAPVDGLRVDSYDNCLRWADAVWPIAPESNGILDGVSREITASGKKLIGSGPETVRLTASKSRTAKVLAHAGIPVVPAFRHTDDIPHGRAWVVKPDDGAGALDTRFFSCRESAIRAAAANGHILQPYIEGDHRSLSLLCDGSNARVLSCNRQLIRFEQGRIEFLGCKVACHPALEYEDLGSRIAAVLPGLRGYCGVDFVQGERGPVVIEVNPRLTTSYVGLSEAIGENVARSVLRLFA